MVELTREESAKAAELYNRLTAADKEWRAFKAGIQSKYGPTLVRDVAEGGKLYHEGIPMPAEWMNGVAFSKDFRFAVPAKAPR